MGKENDEGKMEGTHDRLNMKANQPYSEKIKECRAKEKIKESMRLNNKCIKAFPKRPKRHVSESE